MTRRLLGFVYPWMAMFAASIEAAPPITAIAVAPGGETIVAGSQAGLQILSYPELKPRHSLATKLLQIHDLAFSPDGKALAAAGGTPGQSGEVELYRWSDGDGELFERHAHHNDLIYGTAWNHDGTQWATASLDGTVHLHSTTVRTLRSHSRGVLAVAFLGGGSHLVSTGLDHSLRVWELQTGELRRTLDNHTAAVLDLAVRPARDGLPMIASAGEDKTIRLWQPTIGRLVRFARLPAVPLAIAWTRDGMRICASCRDGHLRLIHPDTVEVLADIPAVNGWAYSLAVSHDGKHAILGGEQGQLVLIGLPTKP